MEKNNIKLTSLGHQSWSVKTPLTHILIDPILTAYFGYSKELPLKIIPERKILSSFIETVDAVIITNYHSDHFHLDSLQLLPKKATIIFSELIPKVVIEAVSALGYKTVRKELWNDYSHNDFYYKLVSGGEEAAHWEKRVSSLIFGNNKNKSIVYLQSETLVSRELELRIKDKSIIKPKVAILTNNSQLVKGKPIGISKNLIPQNHPFHYLENLYMSIYYSSLKLSTPHNIILSGCGFGPKEVNEQSYFDDSDQEIVAKRLSDLSVGQTLYGAKCGKNFLINEKGIISTEMLSVSSSANTNSSITELKQPLELNNFLKNHEDSLNQFCTLFLLSKCAKNIQQVNTFFGENISGKRFCIIFKGIQQGLVFDFNTVSFKIIDLPGTTKSIVKTYPSGLIIDKEHFVKLFKGEIQIWDLIVYDLINQWYLGGPLSSPISFLFEFFDEASNQDLFEKTYNQILENI